LVFDSNYFSPDFIPFYWPGGTPGRFHHLLATGRDANMVLAWSFLLKFDILYNIGLQISLVFC